jgi:hypothetical protein
MNYLKDKMLSRECIRDLKRAFIYIVSLLLRVPLCSIFYLLHRFNKLSAFFNFQVYEFHYTRTFVRKAFFPGIVPPLFYLSGLPLRCVNIAILDCSGNVKVLNNSFGKNNMLYIFRDVLINPAKFSDCNLNLSGYSSIFIGSFDMTFPIQVDKRSERNSKRALEIYNLLFENYHGELFIENMDSEFFNAKALSCGVTPSYLTLGYRVKLKNKTSEIGKKAVLCAHRLRKGRQWSNRCLVTRRCVNDWKDCCEELKNEVSINDFRLLLTNYTFVLCVNGGGLEVAPKIYDAFLSGVYPIVQRSLATSYLFNYPVYFIDDWSSVNLDTKLLIEMENNLDLILLKFGGWDGVLRSLERHPVIL